MVPWRTSTSCAAEGQLPGTGVWNSLPAVQVATQAPWADLGRHTPALHFRTGKRAGTRPSFGCVVEADEAAQLTIPVPGKVTAQRQQFVMAALLNQLSPFQHDYPVHPQDR